MGHFGHLAKVYGIVTHRLSPHELKPLGGLLKDGIPNTVRRIREQIFIVVPRKCNFCYLTNESSFDIKSSLFKFTAFLIGYAVYDWGEREHERLARKNPADYANES